MYFSFLEDCELKTSIHLNMLVNGSITQLQLGSNYKKDALKCVKNEANDDVIDLLAWSLQHES